MEDKWICGDCSGQRKDEWFDVRVECEKLKTMYNVTGEEDDDEFQFTEFNRVTEDF